MDAYICQLQLSIDHALAVSYRRNAYDGANKFVAHITLVKGVPFYGFHVGYATFFKIYLLNPLYITRLADLLRQGAVMSRVWQPHESHMQFLAQWMCDYNLYGCAFMDCKAVRFRWPVPDFLEITSSDHNWHNRTIPSGLISDRNKMTRQSHCSIEIDVSVQDILNRLEIRPRPIHHDFIERVYGLGPEEKLVHSMAGLWRDETKRRKRRMGLVGFDSSPFPPEVLVSVSADPRNSQPGGWIHEEEFRERIRSIIEDEKKHCDPLKMTYESFVESEPCDRQIKTVLQSVEDLYPENLSREFWDRYASSSVSGGDVPLPEEDDDRMILIQEDEYAYESDEELAQDLEASQRRTEETLDAQATYHPLSSERGAAPVGMGRNDATAIVQGPISSGELESLGIRDSGNYEHLEDDMFEVPTAFTSNTALQLGSFHQGGGETRPKRRKILHPVALDKVETHIPKDVITPNNSQVSKTKNRREQGSVKAPPRQNSQEMSPSSQNRQPSPLPRFQLSSEESNRKAIDSKLLFSVVKDPQDPKTVLRLSQKSAGNSISSQSSNKNSVLREPLAKSASAFSDERLTESPDVSTGDEAPSSHILSCASNFYRSFPGSEGRTVLCYSYSPPNATDVQSDIKQDGAPSEIHQDAFYSDEKDVPDRAREYAGREFRLESLTVPYLPDFDPNGRSLASVGRKPKVVVDKILNEKEYERRRQTCSLKVWEIADTPPLCSEVEDWLHEENVRAQNFGAAEPVSQVPSQIDAASQKNPYGFKYSQKQKSTSVLHETQYMSTMSLEVHVNTRAHLLPNPEYDEIQAIFWCIQSEDDDLPVNGFNEGTRVGMLVRSENGGLGHKISQLIDIEVTEESSELELINRMVGVVRTYDPDVLTGYEVHGSSWGYVIERARRKYDYNLCDEFSRTITQSHGRFGKEDDRWGFNHTSTIRVTGRHMINIWRAMRGELNLLQYTMENVVYQLCHKRIPHYTFQDLTSWYSSGIPKHLSKVVHYFASRVQLDLEILEENELIPRTSEQARLLGVDFFSVFSRGSQFKVESLMFRIAKPENLLLPSPSRKQVGQQNALECLPLVMEPQSAFYNSPLLVLDFQSLYPSIMIAYNYCYSTFLGRVVDWRGQNKMGFTDYHRRAGLLELFGDQINIAPNGIMYAKPEIRKSLLAKMLGEILETRVMVKSGMKVDPEDKTLQRLLNNRQLALKFIANVTYGYTSASFSGRMPCSEIADSIVQTARETLEKAIALIHSVTRWNAEVVYGDTDSLFVYLKGRTKDEAFDIGQEISKAITDMNPRPVKLKFEKVYFPCILLAKKRYVGYKYESKTQKVPEFDAKGIETVRRDGTPAEQKIEEKALKILFRTADLSQVKSYFQRQCTKIMSGKVSIQDFCFAKEVKLGTYSDKGLPPPGALISARKMLDDPRAEPQYGERVPYVVITGAPGARLIDRCVAPDVLLHNDNNDLDAEYYISKNLIPPLERIFNLVGANVRQWYDEMPKVRRIRRVDASLPSTSKGMAPKTVKRTIESYMKSSSCIICREKLKGGAMVCDGCRFRRSDFSILKLQSKLSSNEKKAANLERVCRSCAGLAWDDQVKCDSKDCPVFYTRIRHAAISSSDLASALPALDLLRGGDDTGGQRKALEW